MGRVERVHALRAAAAGAGGAGGQAPPPRVAACPLPGVLFLPRPVCVHAPSSHACSCLCAALPRCGAEMFHEMGDIGLKPVVVYHNLRCGEGGTLCSV